MNKKQTLWWIFILLSSVNQILTAQTCDVDGGIISPSGNTVVCSGDDLDDIIEVTLTNNSGENSLWLLTDQNNIIINKGTSSSFNFEGFAEGVIIIYHVSYDGSVSFPGGADLDELTGCFDLSNPISIVINSIDGGVIFDDLNTTVRTVCVDDGIPDLVNLTLNGNDGIISKWVLTDEDGIIIDLPPAPPFSFEGENAGLTIIYNITYDNISGLEEGLSLLDLTGCFDLSNAYQVRKSSGDVVGGTISTGSLTSFCSGDGIADPVTVSVTGNVGDNSRYVSVNSSGEILAVQQSSQFNFEGTLDSQITLWHISYNDGLRNLVPGNTFEDLQGCFGISNFIEVNPEVVNGGIIENINGSNDVVFCTDDGIADMVAIQAGGSVGTIDRYVITDENGIIIDITSNNAFNFEGTGNGTSIIYNIAYNDVPQGFELDRNIINLNGCHALSNPITIVRLSGTVNALTISTDDNTNLCTGDAFPDIVNVDLEGSPGSTGAWVITDEDSIILELPPSPPFDFSDAPPGICRIFYIDYIPGTQGIEVGNKITDFIGCSELSNGITIDRNGVSGGNLSLISGDTSTLICVGNSAPNILPLNLTGNFGSNSRWIVTEGEDSIILISTSNQIDFNITEPGSCKLWHISYEDGIIGLELRETLGDLIGCFDLSNPIIIDKNEGSTFPGTIFTNDPTVVCVGEGSGDNIFFEELPGIGSISNWIVTDSGGKIILIQLSRSIFIDDLPGGTCIVRNIRYEEGITGLEVGGVITDIQGCYSLSNAVSITKNEVNGGSLSIVNNGSSDIVICKEGGSSTIVELTLSGDTGDESRFLLTTPIGNILQVSSIPNFEFIDQQSDAYAIWHISYETGTTGIEVGGNINQLNGCYDLSNPVSVSIQNIDGGNIQTIDGMKTLEICIGEGITDLVEVLLDNVIGQRRSWIITDGSGLITKLPTGPVYNFENEESGILNIYNISYNGEISNLEVGKRISEISGCFDLSNPLSISLSRISAGSLTVVGNGTTVEVCAGDGVADVISFEVTDNEGPVTQLFSIDEEGDIREIFNGMEIDFTGLGQQNILISSISYYTIQGFEIGKNVQDLDGCYDISNTVTVIVNNPKAGNLTNEEGETMMEICVGEGVTDFINIRVSNVVGSRGRWFITDEDGIILENNRTPPFNLENAGSGTCKIYHVRYEGTLSGTAKGLNINTLSGCFNISNALTVVRKNVNASQISYMDGETEKTICLGDDYFFDIELNTQDGEGENQRWAITDTLGSILDIQEDAVFNFDNAGEGTCLIYQVYYNNSISGLEIGRKIDSLEGCFLTSNSVTIHRVMDEACTTSTIELEGVEYSVNIYPNPALSEIYIHSDIPADEIYAVGIYDMNGKRIKRVSPSLLHVPIDVMDFQSGIYFIGFTINGRLHSFRFVKH